MTWLLSHQQIESWQKSKPHTGTHQQCLAVAFQVLPHILQSTSLLIVKPSLVEEDVED